MISWTPTAVAIDPTLYRRCKIGWENFREFRLRSALIIDATVTRLSCLPPPLSLSRWLVQLHFLYADADYLQSSNNTPTRRSKRQRSQSPVMGSSPAPMSPTPAGGRRRSDSRSSLPPSSPPPGLSDTDDSMDERDRVQDIEDEEEDGEDLFDDDNLQASVSLIF
jgi:hypothetical protein